MAVFSNSEGALFSYYKMKKKMVGPLQEWASSQTRNKKNPKKTQTKKPKPRMMVTTVMHLNFQMFLSLNALQYYIAGYVAQMVQKKTTRHVCHEAVGSREHECESAFLTLKHRGNLFKPAANVILCTETEKCFPRMLASTNGRFPQGEGIPDAIAVSVLNGDATYKELDEHMLDTTVNDNHVFKLIKTVSKWYCKVRINLEKQ